MVHFVLPLGIVDKLSLTSGRGRLLGHLLHACATWAVGECVGICAVQGFHYCLEGQESGLVHTRQLSEQHPLGESRHFVASLLDKG